MSNILEMLKKEKVEWKKLGDIKEITVISPKKKLKKKEYLSEGIYPVIDQGQNFIIGYTNDEEAIFEDSAYVIFGDHTESLKYVDFSFAQGADGIKVLKTDEKYLSSKYLFYCILNFYVKTGEYKRHFSILKELEIPIPSLEAQEKIVNILDKFTECTTNLCSELNKELELRTQQYEYYRDLMLSEEYLKKLSKKLGYEGDKLRFVTLGEIAKVTKLAGYEFTKYVNYSDKGKIIALRGLNVKSGKIVLNDVKFIDNSDLDKLNRSKLEKNDILFTYVGTVGEVGLITEDEKYYLAPNVSLIRLNEKNIISSKYLIYLFQTNNFRKKEIDRWIESSSMKNLTMENIRKFKIILPPLVVQEKIVNILDKFHTIVHDLKIGLPREIELRQKQYEYYRDKLLAFEKVD